MASEPMRIVDKQVRVIFPDGLPRGLDASQVKLVVHNPERKADAPVREPAPQPVQPSERSAALPPNEPEPAAAEACPPAPPHGQDDSVPLPSASCLLSSPHKLSRAEAARENGRKSRGPITPEGARSSKNALKHGLASRQIVIGTEEEEEWLEFRDECRQTLKPVGAIELGYADEFAASRWRLRRCLGIETSIFDYQFAMQKIYDEKRCSGMDGVGRTGMAFKSAKDDLTALGRYETRIRRSGERALANLFRLQSMRQNEPKQPDSATMNQPCRAREEAEAAVPVNAESRAQNEPEKLSALADSAESTTAQAPPAAVNPQSEPASKADSLVREPAPEPVQPSERSAAVLQNEPEKPPALDDSAESTTPQAPPAPVNPQTEPDEFDASLSSRGDGPKSVNDVSGLPVSYVSGQDRRHG